MSTGEVCASAATLAELEQVLRRAKFDQYQPMDVRSEFVAMLRRLITLVAVSEADESSVSPPSRDLKDNKFLALVKVCGADALISSDPDLLVLHPWQDVPILTPSAYVALSSA